MSNITLNIVEPSSPTPTPVDPGIDPSVPSTGLFTHGIGGTEATIIAIVSAVLLLTIAAIVIAVLYKKHKKQNKTTKLVHMVDTCKSIAKSKKRITASLTAIALLVSAGTFIALAKNAVNAADTDEQAEGEDDSSLTVNVSEEELTIELGDDPVFAVLPVDVTVEEATEAGYTLTAYADSTDLVSTTDESSTIPMIAVEGDELEALTDNTYGLALGEEPTSKDDEVYTTLSIDQSNPTIIKSMTEYTPTAENDTTTIYYGFYITPDMPYGTYTNDSEVHYNATINTTPVTFDGNGLYFNEDEQQTTNEVEYIAVPEEGKEYNINQIVSGEYKEPSQDLPYNFLGWSTDSTATVPTYTSEQSIAEFLPILPNTPITLYAVWQKATTITYDKNGGTGDMDAQTIIAGESDNLNPNTFTKEGYHFTGWNTDAEGTGQSYSDEADYTAPVNTSQYLILYAQWEEDALYMQNVSEWGSSLEIGDEVIAVDSRDGKEYYVARLADNNIWMTQNLDLDLISDPTAEGYVALTPANTNITADWTPANSTLATEGTSVPGWESSDTTPYSANPGDVYYYTSNTNDNDIQYNSLAECKAAGHTDCAHYHAGNYYNWSAAVAMNDTSEYGDDRYVNVETSICPAGWRLPKNRNAESWTEGNEQDAMVSSYDGIVGELKTGGGGAYAYRNYLDGGFNAIRTNPLWLARSGYVDGGSLSSTGYGGGYWSSTVSSSSSAYQLYFNSGRVGPADGDSRDSGYSVRCIAQ